MNQISVLIVDDHEIVRYGISRYLSSSKDIRIIDEASSGDECLKIFRETEPDVCLLDISMPGKSGIETTKKIREISTDTKILILSMHINKQILDGVLKAGINGYLLKSTGKEEILNGIRSVMKGQEIYSDQISELIKESYLNNSKKNKPDHNGITAREREILQLIVEGYTSKEIADNLYISPRTVDTHRANLMEKLELRNIAELVRYSIENDIVSNH